MNIEKKDGIHPCGTPNDKERGVDFTPSTSKRPWNDPEETMKPCP
jgi:hypothetical protein